MTSSLSETIASHIAGLNAVSELLAANWKAINNNGWGEQLDAGQLALASARAAFEKAARKAKANAKPMSEGE